MPKKIEISEPHRELLDDDPREPVRARIRQRLQEELRELNNTLEARKGLEAAPQRVLLSDDQSNERTIDRQRRRIQEQLDELDRKERNGR